MARITDATDSWSAGVTLSDNEVWQCIEGRVLVTVEASPAAEDGVMLSGLTGLRIASGKTVKYRVVGQTSAVIAREAFG